MKILTVSDIFSGGVLVSGTNYTNCSQYSRYWKSIQPQQGVGTGYKSVQCNTIILSEWILLSNSCNSFSKWESFSEPC